MNRSNIFRPVTRQETQPAAYYEVCTSRTGRADSGAPGNTRQEGETLGEALSIAERSPHAIVSEFDRDGWLLREAYYSRTHSVSQGKTFRVRS